MSRNILISGASSGIGKACAEKFVEKRPLKSKNFYVFASYISRETIQKIYGKTMGCFPDKKHAGTG
jgi:NADP-dependent 3-hydroxy acid dehydrogenase YdfG